jgi:hypothetical protein
MAGFGPHPLFSPPYLGPTGEPESQGDEYIALALRWPKAPAPLYLMVRDGAQALAEIGFDPDTRLLCAITLVNAPFDSWAVLGDETTEVPVEEGLPRCNPDAWIARTRTGSFNMFGDYFLDVQASLRVELRPSEVVVRIGGLAGPVLRELASGRVRCGVDAGGALAYVRLTGLSAREAQRLAEHRQAG